MSYQKPSDKLNTSQRKSISTEPYTPRVRDTNEALPQQISVMKLPVYKPSRDLDQRHGIARV